MHLPRGRCERSSDFQCAGGQLRVERLSRAFTMIRPRQAAAAVAAAGMEAAAAGFAFAAT